jgi:hypothetical protein
VLETVQLSITYSLNTCKVLMEMATFVPEAFQGIFLFLVFTPLSKHISLMYIRFGSYVTFCNTNVGSAWNLVSPQTPSTSPFSSAYIRDTVSGEYINANSNPYLSPTPINFTFTSFSYSRYTISKYV